MKPKPEIISLTADLSRVDTRYRYKVWHADLDGYIATLTYNHEKFVWQLADDKGGDWPEMSSAEAATFLRHMRDLGHVVMLVSCAQCRDASMIAFEALLPMELVTHGICPACMAAIRKACVLFERDEKEIETVAA